MKSLFIAGARPQFIKLAPMCHAYERHNCNYDILHTGQHYDANMSDLFFSELDIPKPKYHLNAGSKSHGHQTADILKGIEDVLVETKYDQVITFGDTNSTLSAALAAVKLHIPVAHVEAGLRSFNRAMPEEINRIMTDHISEWLFCPTRASVQHLEDEGIRKNVYHVGDIMYDACKEIQKKSSNISGSVLKKSEGFDEFFLVTIHRPENTDYAERLENIFCALNEVSERSAVILPLHPRTKKALTHHNIQISPNITLCDPLGILEMHALLASSRCLLTDSGGMQKEAYFYKTPCITLRDETEWTETVDSGWNQITGAHPQRILAAISNSKEGSDIEDYRNGTTAESILEILQK